jgi:transposase
MLKKEIKKIFNLEGYIFDKMKNVDNKIILHCHLQKKFMSLNSERSKSVNEVRNRLIAHTIFEEKKVYISIKQRRFYFPKQKKKAWETLPQVKKNQQMTTNFKKSLYLN